MTNSDAPAGWYGQPDGRLRYWDGRAWTEHFAPGVAQQIGAPLPAARAVQAQPLPAGATAGRGSQPVRPWFKKKRVLLPTAALATFVLIGAFAPDSTQQKPVKLVATGEETSPAPETTTGQADQEAAEKAAAEQAEAATQAKAAAAAKAKAEAASKAKAAAAAKAKAEAAARAKAAAAAKAKAAAAANAKAEAAAKAAAERKANTPVPLAGGGSVYYKNCTAARAAGVTPIYRGEPGYASHLDRDNDGVACE